jgi:hypothetical protein
MHRRTKEKHAETERSMPAHAASKERAKRHGITHCEIAFQDRVGALNPRAAMASHELPLELKQARSVQSAPAVAL